MHHYFSVYTEDGVKYAEAWIQINFFGLCFCCWKVKKAI